MIIMLQSASLQWVFLFLDRICWRVYWNARCRSSFLQFNHVRPMFSIIQAVSLCFPLSRLFPLPWIL